MIATLIDSALALLFPAHCAACDDTCEEDAAFCRTCAVTLERIDCACARCGLPTLRRLPRCLGCLARPPSFATARAPCEFGGALAVAIRRLKWAARPELARRLAPLLPLAALDGVDLIAPVPLHPRRLRQREFNQAALLALSYCDFARRRRLKPPPVDLGALERVRDTAPQATLAPGERHRNVRGAFHADPARVAGRRVLVVDDVMTTGATAEACAAALRDAGALDVAVLTVARAVP